MRPLAGVLLGILLGLSLLGPAPSWPERLEPGLSPLEAWDVIDAKEPATTDDQD